MERSISISGLPKWLLQTVVAGIAALLALWGVTPGIEMADRIVGLARRQSESEGDWWDPIPSRQYAGRFAEAGSLARAEWEKALSNDRDEDE